MLYSRSLLVLHCKYSSVYVCVSHLAVSNSVNPWTVAHQAPLSMEFSRQEYQSGLPFPSPGDIPDPVIELMFPALQDTPGMP